MLLALPALSCAGRGTDAEVRRLRARVDSLAVTVTAMKAAIESGGVGREGPDTLTVGAAGVAVLGATTAPVTIVEFTDYQCPFCGQHAQTTFGALRAEYVDSGRVRYVVRDLPLPMHQFAEPAARAAPCVAQQDAEKYWRFHDAVFEAQSRLSDSTLVGIASGLGLDRGRFESCKSSDAVAKLVRRDADEAAQVGLTGTPAFVIGRAVNGKVTGVVIRGAFPLSNFRQAIEGALKQTPGVASVQRRTSPAGGTP
jgi:protein-disulfide isomerase